ncbi:hypothetical protein [Salinigranum sp. GCM10025319]|uniref:hypothetical protein n=1 Tax=Salinigranum sp. GCM10025319 TaxID=3252687 RepID=UPI00362105F9
MDPVGADRTPAGTSVVRQIGDDSRHTPAPDGSVTARSAVESLSEGLEEYITEYLTGPSGIPKPPFAFVMCGAAADCPHVDAPYNEFVIDTNGFLGGVMKEANLQAEAVALVPSADSPRDAHAGAISWAAMRALHTPDGGRRFEKSTDYRDWWESGSVLPMSDETGQTDQSGRSRREKRRVRLREPPVPVGVVTRAREEDGRERGDGLSHAIAAGTVFGGYMDRLDTVWQRTATRPSLRPSDPTTGDGDGTDRDGDAEGDGDGTDGIDGGGDGDSDGTDGTDGGNGDGEGSSDERTGAVDRGTDERVAVVDPRSRLVATVGLSPELFPEDGGVARIDLGHNYVLLADPPEGATPAVSPLRASFDVPIGPGGRRRTTASTEALDGMWPALGRELRTSTDGRPGASASSLGANGSSALLTVVGASLVLHRAAGDDSRDVATGIRFEHDERAYEAQIVAPPGADSGYVPSVVGIEVDGADGGRTVRGGNGFTAEDRRVFDAQGTPAGDPETKTVELRVAVEGSLVNAVDRAAADPSSPLSETVRQSAPGDAVGVTGWYVEEWADQAITVDTGWITPAQMTWATDVANSRMGRLPREYGPLARDGWVNVRFEAAGERQSYAARLRDGRVVEVVPDERDDAWLTATVELDAAHEILASPWPARTASAAYSDGRIRLAGRGLMNGISVGLLEAGWTVSRTVVDWSRGLPFGRPERRGPSEPGTGEREDPLFPPLG